ncbi:hypothetical protein BQ8482_110092 [Mesorhizobium delmotii]|uniref:Uncharacterized protein n=1 Tax=Mesorhizobium delmotii TaxID=1631247 RepID=A0A2P9AAL0_9HYPH|nr:hypothetical protein BQ8482_110092 [Mesorhizobium delmotii]
MMVQPSQCTCQACARTKTACVLQSSRVTRRLAEIATAVFNFQQSKFKGIKQLRVFKAFDEIDVLGVDDFSCWQVAGMSSSTR